MGGRSTMLRGLGFPSARALPLASLLAQEKVAAQHTGIVEDVRKLERRGAEVDVLRKRV